LSVIVIEFITLDGIVTDPDGSGGTPAGGWAFRHGPKRSPGTSSGSAACWMRESCCWAGRPGSCSPGSGPGATTRSRPGWTPCRSWSPPAPWPAPRRGRNSQAVDGDLIDAVKRQRRDVIITGSLSIVHTLI